MKRILMLCLASSLGSLSFGQAIYNQLEQNVNGFTGDFNYGVPLVTLTGPNGEYFPVQMSYQSGIQVNADAGWVGLGWNLTLGEIQRYVNGHADDWKNEPYVHTEMKTTGNVVNTYNAYGPMYFRDMTPGSNSNDIMDLYQSFRHLNAGETAFEFPDYDQYVVNAPGLSGRMEMRLFDFANLWHKDGTNTTYRDDNIEDYTEFTKRPEFYVNMEPAAQVKAPYYGNTTYDPNCQCWDNTAGTNWTGLSETNFTTVFKKPFQLDNNDATHAYHGDFDSTTNRMHSAWYVEYFTNAEIVAGVTGFKEAHEMTLTVRQGLNGDDIGAYRVTGPNGMVYHFSLPVYAADDQVTSFVLNPNDLAAPLDQANQYDKSTPYVRSWKLTAITGVDYEDEGDDLVGEGDQGYWIAFNYVRLSNDYAWRTPYYGYFYNQQGVRHPDFYQAAQGSTIYEHLGTVTTGTNELYYPERVYTASQSLYFVKDYRLDGNSVEKNGIRVPKLALKRLVLLDNDDIQSTWFNPGAAPSSSFFNTTNLGAFISEVDYAADKTAIEAVSLKTIELDQSYSLAPGAYDHIENTFTTQGRDLFSGGPEMYREITSSTATHGKLTLNKIRTYEFGHEDILPPAEFYYREKTDDGNVYEYHHHQKDYFGFYKSDWQHVHQGYITEPEQADVAAWSLEKIVTPMGAELNIEYESDQYAYVGYDSDNSLPVPVTRYFAANTVTGAGATNAAWANIYLHDDNALTMLQDANKVSAWFPIACLGGSGSGLLSVDKTDQYSVTGTALTLSGMSHNLLNCSGSGNSFSSSGTGSVYQAGYVELHMDRVYGGGVRVKRISASDPVIGDSYKVDFIYDEGIATGEMDLFDRIKWDHLQPNRFGGDRHSYTPGVGYSNVTVHYVGDADHLMGSTEYHFVNYMDTWLPTRHRVKSQSNPFYYEVIKINEDQSRYGKLRSVVEFDAFGHRVKRTEFEYDNVQADKARIEEAFYRFQNITASPSKRTHSIFYKSRLTSHLKAKHTWEDGLMRSVEYLDRDPLTGAPTVVITSDPTDDGYKVEYTPAFRESAYSAMTAKSIDPNGANLLTFVSEENYFKKYGASYDRVGGTKTEYAQTHARWQYQAGSTQRFNNSGSATVWAPEVRRRYVKLDGQNQPVWELNGQTTLLGGDDVVLETRNIDNYFGASKYGYDLQYKIASASNSNYASFTHCSFEGTYDAGTSNWFFDGEVTNTGSVGLQSTSNGSVTAHTGSHYVTVPAAAASPPQFHIDRYQVSSQERGLEPGRTYRVAVWMHQSSAADAQLKVYLGGTSSDANFQATTTATLSDADFTAGSWKLITLDVFVPSDYTSSSNPAQRDFEVTLLGGASAAGYFDDLQVRPVDALITAYITDTRRGLTLYEIDGDNLYTRYEHDAAGTVIRTFVETSLGEKKVNEAQYEFAR